jgi:hypothetical protein
MDQRREIPAGPPSRVQFAPAYRAASQGASDMERMDTLPQEQRLKQCSLCRRDLPLQRFRRKGGKYPNMRRYICRTCESRYAAARENGYARHTFVPPVVPPWCDICGLSRELLADHCHTTGMFRGWLCTRCNQLVAFVESDLGLKARAYLDTAPARSVRLLALQPPRKRVPPGQLGGLGRPSLLTAKLVAAVADAADANGAIRLLSEAGISRRTHQAWRTLGRRGVAPYDQFVAALRLHGLDHRYAF